MNDFLISRAELQAILSLAQVSHFPGLQPQDPALGELSPEQEAYGILCGERALRARGLAFIDPEGTLRIHNDLLRAVGVCAWAPNMLTVTHFPPQSDQAAQFSIFHLDDDYVAHLLPDPALFQFNIYPHRQAVVEDLCRLCPQPQAPTSVPAFQVPADVLQRVQQAADASQPDQALALLGEAGVAPESATAFIEVLSKPHTTLIFQALQRPDPDTLTIQSATILSTDHDLWVAVPLPPSSDPPGNDTYQLQPIQPDALAAMIDRMAW